MGSETNGTGPMRAALDYFLRKAGIVRRTTVAPVKSQPLPPTFIPVPAAPELVQAAGDANEETGKDAEPAMAGIPEDAVQMPTPAAPAPGLPPVDPTKARKKSLAKVEGTARKAPSSRRIKGGEGGVVGRRSPATGSRNWQDARYRVED